MGAKVNVTVEEKKDFLRWFLNHFQLKKRESVWILNYLMNREDLLKNIRFVQYVEFCPLGIRISAQGVPTSPFRFYKGQVMTTDAEKSFHHLRMNKEEEWFIELCFEGVVDDKPFPHQYARVLEENPYVNEDYHLEDKDKLEAQDFLDTILSQAEINRIKQGIDQSLESKDKETFQRLSKELAGLKPKSKK